MAKVFKYLLLPSSLLLNLCLLLLFFSFDGLPSFIASHGGLTWSKKPARDAESVAALNCSGHGRAFLDGVLLHGTPVCECYGCYAGPDCSEFRPEGCVVEVDSGAPLFMEPYWIQHQRDGAVMMSVWHRMSYYMIGESMISSELERHIRGLHNIVGNANVTGKFIVFGVGAMQLLNAAVYALSINENSVAAPPAKVVATVPYYPVYRIQTELLNARSFQWHGNTSQWENESDQSANFIEYVTSPSNPDGGLREAVLTGPLTKAVYDRVYYWPHFSAIPSPADEDIMIFSLGKITGHAGSRFGWAIIKDEKLSQKFMDYVETNVITVSHDTQLRALMIVKAILGRSKEVFEFGHKTLRDKWQRLNSAISKSKRFSLQKLDPQYCTYFRAIREPSPGYAWLKCEMEEDKDCHAVFSAVGIVGNEGAEFGDESKYVRLSLTKSQDEFEVMLSRIEGLVAEGKEGPKSI